MRYIVVDAAAARVKLSVPFMVHDGNEARAISENENMTISTRREFLSTPMYLMHPRPEADQRG
jgi:hypothetical protein